MGIRSRGKRARWRQYPDGIKTFLRDQRLQNQKRENRVSWLVGITLLIIVALLQWRKNGGTAAWDTVVVLIGFGLEAGVFLALLSLVWGLIRNAHPDRDLLRYVLVTGSAAVALHTLNPLAMSVVPRFSIVVAVAVFTAMKIFRRPI
jgi:hypothetical protein